MILALSAAWVSAIPKQEGHEIVIQAHLNSFIYELNWLNWEIWSFWIFFCYNLVLSYWVHNTIETIWDAVNISTVFLLEQQLCFFIIKFIYRSQLLLLFVMSVNKNVSIRLWNIGISGSLEAVN